jgi:hypothetical protein
LRLSQARKIQKKRWLLRNKENRDGDDGENCDRREDDQQTIIELPEAEQGASCSAAARLNNGTCSAKAGRAKPVSLP